MVTVGATVYFYYNHTLEYFDIPLFITATLIAGLVFVALGPYSLELAVVSLITYLTLKTLKGKQ